MRLLLFGSRILSLRYNIVDRRVPQKIGIHPRSKDLYITKQLQSGPNENRKGLSKSTFILPYRGRFGSIFRSTGFGSFFLGTYYYQESTKSSALLCCDYYSWKIQVMCIVFLGFVIYLNIQCRKYKLLQLSLLTPIISYAQLCSSSFYFFKFLHFDHHFFDLILQAKTFPTQKRTTRISFTKIHHFIILIHTTLSIITILTKLLQFQYRCRWFYLLVLMLQILQMIDT